MLKQHLLAVLLVGAHQGVAAARVGPVARKGDLLVGALLEQQLAVRVEDEHAERPVHHALVDVDHQMACAKEIEEEEEEEEEEERMIE